MRSVVAPQTEGEDSATVTIHIPMEFRRGGGRKEIILPPDADTTPDVGPRKPIVVTLARGYRWQQMLDSGEAASLGELAGRYGVDRSYVGRMLKVASLAPEIVAAVLTGTESRGLSMRALHGSIPASWEE